MEKKNRKENDFDEIKFSSKNIGQNPLNISAMPLEVFVFIALSLIPSICPLLDFSMRAVLIERLMKPFALLKRHCSVASLATVKLSSNKILL